MLTPKQAELLRYLTACQEGGDSVSPTFDQMALALGLKSKSGIHRIITALEERGFIRRFPRRARSIVVVCHPGEAPLATGEVTLDDLRYMVGLLCQQDGFAVTCAALISMAREIVPTPEAQ